MKTLLFAFFLLPVVSLAGTIYQCKSYGGGIFWAAAHCNTHNALIERIASVPDGLPFNQQVQIAQGQASAAAALQKPISNADSVRSDNCVALKAERDKIESRYSNWQWQPPEVINPDQTRMLGLRAEQRRFGCPTQ